jgi:hypothetical protein
LADEHAPPHEAEYDEYAAAVNGLEEYREMDTNFLVYAEEEATAEAVMAEAAEEEGNNNDDLESWSNGPDLEEQSAEQRALHESYETLRKEQNNARVGYEAFEEK